MDSQLKHFDRERLIWNSNLPPNERYVLLALNTFVDAEGCCFPEQETLAEMMGVHRRTVIRLTENLIEKGIVCRKRRRFQGRQTSNIYQVKFARLDEFQRPPKEKKQTTRVTEDHLESGDRGSHGLLNRVTEDHSSLGDRGSLNRVTEDHSSLGDRGSQDLSSELFKNDLLRDLTKTPLTPQGGESSPSVKNLLNAGEKSEPSFEIVSTSSEQKKASAKRQKAGKRKKGSAALDLTANEVKGFTPGKLAGRFSSSDALLQQIPWRSTFEEIFKKYQPHRVRARQDVGCDDIKTAAAAWWIIHANDFYGYGWEGFKAGCSQWLSGSPSAVPDFSRFLFGNQREGSGPYWMRALEASRLLGAGAEREPGEPAYIAPPPANPLSQIANPADRRIIEAAINPSPLSLAMRESLENNPYLKRGA